MERVNPRISENQLGRSEDQRRRRQEINRRNYENNREIISLRRREARSISTSRQRNTTECQYLGESLSDNCPALLIGGLTNKCNHCEALLFQNEHGRIKHNCCHHGKVQLPPLSPYPEALKELIMGNSSDAQHFRQNIRSYNAAFAMAAFSPAEEILFKGISCVTVRGEVNTLATTSIIPKNTENPRYAQIYIHENDVACSYRLSDKCRLPILQTIQGVMNCNPYVQKYKTLYQRYEEHPEEDVQLVFQRCAISDGRRYNLPNSSATAEVAAVIVTGNEGCIPSTVDFVVYPKQNHECQKLYKLSQHVEPLVFPLLFPSGTPGYYLDMKINSSTRRITAVQYFGWQLRVTNTFNIITMAGRLTQQYIIHGFITNEWNRLNYIGTHQNQFRRESVQGLLDHVEHSAANSSDAVRLGRVMFLPSTYEGSPRSMQQHFQDAMALSREVGRPDLFVTFTANPQWPELRDFLITLPAGYTASDIPHVVVRAFFVRFDAFINEIASGAVFGKILGYTYNVEFQKRGLPHAHCLFILNPRDKLLTPEALDRFICAEIPDKDNFPNWHGKVMKHMLHGPHCAATPCFNSATGVCKKKFPHAFTDFTDMSGDGFPLYKRSDNRMQMLFYNKRVNNRLIPVDNSMVVPYNPYLLMKYDCHINVEYCGSIMAYKYIFKYVNKGHDRIHVKVTSKEEQSPVTNEIQNYVDTRYVSSMEAAWRLLELPLHQNSHTVIRLPVHLPGQQCITFQEGHETEALQSRNSLTQLMAFFKLNCEDPEARQFKYTDIPKHYVWVQGDRKWKKRQRGGDKLIVRLYSVSPKDSERFFLKFLLQHVYGALSFEDLRTVDGIQFSTFREAAYCLGFGESDDKVDEILDEVCHCMMPKQFRIFFAHLLLTCAHVNARQLWEKFRLQMCENSDEQVCLQDIEHRLKSEDKTLSDYGLPTLQSAIPTHFDDVSTNDHRIIAENMISQLNSDQREAFHAIVSTLSSNSPNKLFFIDGPGGTGKTFLYKCLYHYQRQYSKNVLCVAWTGIAAVLLPNGRTAHRVFKLPIKMPAAEEHLTPLFLDKNAKKYLTKTDFIIWDEASMIPGVALRLIDITLQDLLKSSLPFGGKSILFGGDFRQVLPVIKRAGKDQIICGTVKNLGMWTCISHFQLKVNMRASEEAFANWLLSIGNGDLDFVDVSEMLCSDLITETFGPVINIESLQESVLLAPLNDQVNQLNLHVLNRLPGDIINCYAYDKATAVDGDDTDDETVMLRFQPEYLAKLNITGLPLHKLSLKVGSVIMLIRNLCITDGLCNGTRLIVQKITKSALFCTIMTGDRAGNVAVIPRITLNTKDNNEFPFVLHRTQFPVRLAFAMTINKSQGQTFNKVGLFIDQNCPIFGHGQLYVALTRCRTKEGLKVKIIGSRTGAENTTIKNIVFKEVLCKN